MHRESGGDTDHAPGLTPLTAQYQRPGQLYACYRRDVPQLSFVTDHDASDEFTYCVPAGQVAEVAKFVYYGVKLIKLLRGLPVPPP